LGANEESRWKSPENIWKREPFLVTALPTIIKVTADGVSTMDAVGAIITDLGQRWERLVEEDVYDQAKLNAFVG
jgi:hypothetical protein